MNAVRQIFKLTVLFTFFELPLQAQEIKFGFNEVQTLKDQGVARRDPSDVIKVDGKCYVWYTKIIKGRSWGYPSGYNGSVWGAVSEDDGHTWKEMGEAIPQGKPGTFDSFSTFTPNILKFKGRYYLYYTAVADGFTNKGYSKEGKTAFGLAIADKPEGPWKKLEQPIMKPSTDKSKFDSYRIDDTCMLIRDGKVWMYYKGRMWGFGPGKTKMGVAIAETPEGPYVRQNEGNPVQDSGHEVQIWQEGKTVYSLVSQHGPNGKTVQKAEDGISFKVISKLKGKQPKAPGLYRPELTEVDAEQTDPKKLWGICMHSYGGDLTLDRYTIELSKGKVEAKGKN